MAAVAVSGVVLAAVVAVIVVFGFIPLPEFASLVEAPNPAIQGTVAFLGDNGCISVVPASGGPAREVSCDWPGPLAWTPAGTLVVFDYLGATYMVEIDPDTGAELRRSPAPDVEPFLLTGDRTVRADGARIVVDSDFEGSADAYVVGSDGSRTSVIAVEGAPRDYHLLDWGVQWSPDGRWIAIWDTEGRLLVAGDLGAPDARVLVDVEDASGEAAWYIPGETTYTVELP